MHLTSFLIVALGFYLPLQIGGQGNTTPAPTTPASTTPASTTPASTTAASTTPVTTNPQPTTKNGDPKVIQVNCTSAYMPLSDADLAAMQNNGTPPAGQTNLSTIPTEAACKSIDPNDKDGSICDIKSCGSPQPTVCSNCFEATMQNGQVTKVSQTPVPQVQCQGGYFIGSGNATDNNGGAGAGTSICTGQDQKTYSCSDQCQNMMSCTSCVSLSDPALAGP